MLSRSHALDRATSSPRFGLVVAFSLALVLGGCVAQHRVAGGEKRTARVTVLKTRPAPVNPDENVPDEAARVDRSDAPQPSVWRPGGQRQIWMLGVGIGEYSSAEVPALAYAASDAQKTARWFEENAGLPSENVRLLLNEQATRRNLLTQLDWLRRSTMPEDLLVLYIACHGAPEIAADGASVDARYLVLHDSDPASLFATGLSLDELHRLLTGVRAKVQVLMLECCYSGPVGIKAMAGAQTSDLSIRARRLEEVASRGGRLVLSASTGKQVAISAATVPAAGSPDAAERVDGGLFTHFLLESLGAGRRPLMEDCFKQTWDRTRRAASALGAWQEPKAYGDVNVDVVLRE